MLGWVLVFFLLAIFAAIIGFGGLAGTFAGIAKLLFFVFLVLLAISLVFRAARGQPPT